MKIKTMAAGKFKAQCLAVLDEVQEKRQPVVITKHGKKVAKLVPMDSCEDDLLGSWKGRIQILGDIVSPAYTAEEWGDLA
jgi:prevent-host-death family protein